MLKCKIGAKQRENPGTRLIFAADKKAYIGDNMRFHYKKKICVPLSPSCKEARSNSKQVESATGSKCLLHHLEFVRIIVGPAIA